MNGDEPRYASPLAGTCRPMAESGTRPSSPARMHRLAGQAGRRGVLTMRQDEQAIRLLAGPRGNFAKGWEIVERDARLTPHGQDILQCARRHMEAHASG